METPWQPMTAARFAAFEGDQGNPVVAAGGIYWRRVRPCFYRPLLPYLESDPTTAGPGPSRLGGVQFPTTAPAQANSRLNLLMFLRAPEYSAASLDGKRRWELKNPSKLFEVRPLRDVSEFKRLAHSVYLSFYDRTGYAHKAERRQRDAFERWADALYSYPEVGILAAFKGSELGAVSISQCLGNTVLYSTMFSDQSALKQGVAGLMLHRVREAAAATPGVTQVMAGFAKSDQARGIDDFYLHRGCELVSKPAVLRLNPVARVLLAQIRPRELARLRGEPPLTTPAS